MNHYLKYQVEDFVQDLRFRAWALDQAPQDHAQWATWLAQHPAMRPLVDEARSLVVATQVEEVPIGPAEVAAGIQAILARTAPRPVVRRAQFWRRTMAIAASVALVGAVAWWWGQENEPASPTGGQMGPHNAAIENPGPSSFSLKLSDGTRVTLQRQSQLRVAPDFGRSARTVYLVGEAFFEVKKDAQRPFLVVAGGVVSKVLGTSFSVRAYGNEANTLVKVATGKVAVYQALPAGGSQPQNPATQILLTPNQQVVFEKEKEKMVKTVVETPALLDPQASKKIFLFEETPVKQVFAQLEASYGIRIVYDAELLADCDLTAEFDQETLYEKIDIICEAIQASYEIADGQIVIYAKGCR